MSLFKISYPLILINVVQILSFGDYNLVILQAVRNINIESPLTKIDTQLTLINNRSNPMSYFNWTIAERGIFSYIDAWNSERKEQNTSQALDISIESTYCNIYFLKPLEPKDSIEIVVSEIYGKGLTPYPSAIKQNEDQLILYEGNIYLQTSYYIVSISTFIILPTNEIESYSKDNTTVEKNKIISYGPYSNIPPFTSKKLKVHFKNNDMFLIVPEVKRKIRVSPWGTIYIEEKVMLLHAGAKLKGPFLSVNSERYRGNSVGTIGIILPAAAKNIRFYDDIGVIWNWITKDKIDYLLVLFRTRFELLGGWKIEYHMTYELPVYEHIFQNLEDKNTFTLKMKFVDHIFKDMFIEKIETQVELPVLSSVTSKRYPYLVKSLPTQCNYLPFDIFHLLKPRQILTFSKTNLVENHIKDFQIKYKWDLLNLLWQPFLNSIFLFHIFLFVIIYVRLDFPLTVNDKKNKIAKHIGDFKK